MRAAFSSPLLEPRRDETRPYWSAKRTKNAPVKHHLSQGTAGDPETEPQYDQSRDGAYTDEPTGLPTVSGGSGRC